MKVYFNASPRFKKNNPDLVSLVYKHISDFGFTHTTDFIITVKPDEFYLQSDEQMNNYYRTTTQALKQADIVVLDMSIPSLAIGYLASYALSLGKPLLALHTVGNEPFFLLGAEDDKLQTVEYTKNNLAEVLKMALDYASGQQDTRFNFFVSPRISNYLDWVAKHKRLPRAVYLRKLIEEDMARRGEDE